MSDHLAHLNPAQRKAVEQTQGPMMVIAGAGSGKTRVLTYRIAQLLKEGVDPFNVLSLTFTNKAAGEMKSRVEKIVGSKASRVNIGTFHSICARILRYEIDLLGFNPNFAIYDAADQLNLIKSIINSNKIPIEGMTPNAIRGRISLAKNSMEESKLDNKSSSPVDRAAALVYPLYTKALKENNALDFDDLLLFPLKVFNKKPAILKKYQERSEEHV